MSTLDIYLNKAIRLKDISNFIPRTQLSLSVITLDKIRTCQGMGKKDWEVLESQLILINLFIYFFFGHESCLFSVR